MKMCAPKQAISWTEYITVYSGKCEQLKERYNLFLFTVNIYYNDIIKGSKIIIYVINRSHNRTEKCAIVFCLHIL